MADKKPAAKKSGKPMPPWLNKGKDADDKKKPMPKGKKK